MDDLFSSLKIGGQILKTTVEIDKTLTKLTQMNDFNFDGNISFKVPTFIPPQEFKIGLIVGPSGTGKTSLLKCFGKEMIFKPNHKKAVASQIDPNLLMKMGLGSIPNLCKPYHVLSNGEKHRVDLAYALMMGGKVFDEFTSTVHRSLARNISISLKKYIDKNNITNFVVSSCHEDIIEYLHPDWVFNTNTKQLIEWGLERQPIKFTISKCDHRAWRYFKDFHYLTSELNKASSCWALYDEKSLAGFYAALSFPGPVKNAYRGHRLVIHPDYQGMGLSSILVEYVASFYTSNNKRFFTKTAHPKLGLYRDNSIKWRATSKNHKKRLDYNENNINKYDVKNKEIHKNRLCYSHEFIG